MPSMSYLFGSFGSLLKRFSASQLTPRLKKFAVGALTGLKCVSTLYEGPALEAPEIAVPSRPVPAPALVRGRLTLAPES